MALRKNAQPAEQSQAKDSQVQQLKVNPEIDQKIDEFIQNNPKQFEYYNTLPKDRLVRVVILKDIQAQERTERTKSAILRKLDSDPEMKKSVEALVKNLPEEKKRSAMVSIAARTFRMQSQSAQQKTGGSSITPGS